MHSGASIRLVGLDVTTQVRLTRDHAARMAASGREFGAFAGKCTIAWLDKLARERPGDPASGVYCAMHDPLAVAALSKPGLLTWQDAAVDVLTAEPSGRGVAIADLQRRTDAPEPNTRIAVAVEVDAFMEYFLEAIATY